MDAYIFLSKNKPKVFLSMSQHPEATRQSDELFLQKVRMLIEQHLTDDLRIVDLAKAVFYSRVHFFGR